jgi:hypothetical protein
MIGTFFLVIGKRLDLLVMLRLGFQGTDGGCDKPLHHGIRGGENKVFTPNFFANWRSSRGDEGHYASIVAGRFRPEKFLKNSGKLAQLKEN